MARTKEQAPDYNAARRKAAVKPDEWRRRLDRDGRSRKNNPNKTIWYRKHDLHRHYNLTIEEWNELFDAQGKCCAICKSEHPGNKKGHWNTDHDHDTNQVRGILCQPCNRMLGAARDNPDWLLEGAKYLGIGGSRPHASD